MGFAVRAFVWSMLYDNGSILGIYRFQSVGPRERLMVWILKLRTERTMNIRVRYHIPKGQQYPNTGVSCFCSRNRNHGLG